MGVERNTGVLEMRSDWGKSSTPDAAAGAGIPADLEATQPGEAALCPRSINCGDGALLTSAGEEGILGGSPESHFQVFLLLLRSRLQGLSNEPVCMTADRNQTS